MHTDKHRFPGKGIIQKRWALRAVFYLCLSVCIGGSLFAATSKVFGPAGELPSGCDDGEIPVWDISAARWICGAGGGGGGGTPGGSNGQAQYRIDASTFGGFPLLWNGTVMTFPGSRVRIDANGDLEVLNSSWQLFSAGTIPLTIGSSNHQGTVNLRGGNTLSVAGITAATLLRANTTNTPGTVAGIQSPAAAVRGMVVQGAASQSANLVELRNSAGTFLTGFDPAGNFSGTAAALGADPTDCAGGLFANAIVASGNLGCIAVDWSAIADKPSTFAPAAHAAAHAENGADEVLVENLGTGCPIGQIAKSDGAGGMDCADDDNSGGASSATESAEGVAEIATQGEVDAGTDDQRFITPLKLEESAQLAAKADAAHAHALADLSDVSGKSGNTEEVATVAGAKTQSKQLAFDASGNVIASTEDIGGVGTGATQISELSDLQVTRDADTGVLNIAAGRAGFGNTVYSIAAATAEMDDASTTGDAELFIAQDGSLVVAHTIGMTVVCTGCTASDTGAGIPVTAIALARWSSASSGVWDASGTERRALSNGIIPVNGAGLCASDSGGIRTFLLCIDGLTEQADPADTDKIFFERESDDAPRKMTIVQLKTEVADGTGTDDQTAAEVPSTPAGDLGSTTAQDALNELDTEKAPVSHTHTESQVSDLQHRTAGAGLADNGDALELDIAGETGQADPLDADLLIFERASDGLLRKMTIGELKTEIGTGSGNMSQSGANDTDNSVSVGVGTSGTAFEKTPVTIDPTTGDIVTPGSLTAIGGIAGDPDTGARILANEGDGTTDAKGGILLVAEGTTDPDDPAANEWGFFTRAADSVLVAQFGTATESPVLLVSSQHADTNITADVEEETHASEHASGGGDAVDHDALTNFVANEHIDHTAVTLAAGAGLSGGGDISANRSFATASQEAAFLADGGATSLTCGGGNGGKMQVMDDGTLEICDGAATPALQVFSPGSGSGNMSQSVANATDNTVSVSVGTSGTAFEKTGVTIDPATDHVVTPGSVTAAGLTSTGAAGSIAGGDGSGSERVTFRFPATIAANRTCQLLDQDAMIPAGCVDGTPSESNNLEADGASGIATTEVFIGNATGAGVYAALSGDATMDNTGVVTVSNAGTADALTNNPASLGTTYCIDRAADGSCATAGDLDDLGGAVATAQIENDAVTRDKVSAALRTRQIGFKFWGTGASFVLQDADDELSIFNNQLGQGITITEVVCESDTGTPTFQLQKDDGAATNMLSANLTCGTTPASTTGFVSTENAIADGNRIDALIVAAGGTAHWVAVTIVYTLD